ncbi:RNA-guided endonuclease InsQ/TnpB family protein [Dictyobacter kobayashii]|uniref:Transposase n=1 Tax=Dictyobacter kobayashii TaxID=2014872 RepID=A0A402AST2_9CHLR|nr:RNA-guided endonuclease TnpB family protein [Dictyobacter kobayashii]GCE22141.1 transposase [Dictyobacter kobayashii]
MLLCTKIRIEVSDQDAATLEFMQGKCRGLYNWLVMQQRDGARWNLYEAKKTLRESKQYDPELRQVYGKLLQEVYFRLDKAMKAFFTRVKAGKTPGFPRVRPRHCFFTLCYPAMYLTVEHGTIELPTGGKGKNKRYPNIIAKLTEEPPMAFKEVAISRDARGHYYASFVSEHPEEPCEDNGVIAFDLGIKTLATGINEQGRIYTIGGFKGARWYNRQLDHIRSKRDKCTKKSRRYKHLSTVHKRVSEKKRQKQRDSLHKASHLISHKLVESTVVVGDLSQRQMVMKEHQQKNKRLNRMVYNDWGLFMFLEMLTYKCQLYGKELHMIDERDTSKMCSQCHELKPMPLWKRTYCCVECGLVMDRDENSAINILTRFLARRGPHTDSSETCGVLQKDQNSGEVMETSCPTLVQQRRL